MSIVSRLLIRRSHCLIHGPFVAIYSLGNDLTYELVKPILDRCTVEQLLRFEKLSPASIALTLSPSFVLTPPLQQHLRNNTPREDIFPIICCNTY
jgi:hypothetical protein